jgi:hypothetical protein
VNVPDLWQHDAGTGAYRVTVVERPSKDGMLYVRWYDREAPAGKRQGGCRYRSLGRRLRDEQGTIDQATAAWAIRKAELYSKRLAHAPALTPGRVASLPPDPLPGDIMFKLVSADTERLIERWGLEAEQQAGQVILAPEVLRRCAADLAAMLRMWKDLGR